MNESLTKSISHLNQKNVESKLNIIFEKMNNVNLLYRLSVHEGIDLTPAWVDQFLLEFKSILVHHSNIALKTINPEWRQ